MRHLRSRRRHAFVSLITVISVLGIMLGVAALITVIAVMTGFSSYMQERILGTTSHILVTGTGGLSDPSGVLDEVKGHPEVVAAAPYVMGQSLLKTNGDVTGVVIRGIDPHLESSVTDLSKNMVEGAITELDDKGIIIGIEMSRQRGLRLGDSVTLVSPSEISSPFGMVPIMERFAVAGIFDTGMYEYDTGLVLVTIPAAREFFDLGEMVTGVAVKVRDVYTTEAVAEDLQESLGYSFWVRDWKEMNQNLFSALKLEKITMFVILVLIVVVAAFNIIGTLILVVMEKGREIAILKAMGATRKSIGKIFMIEGLVIGLGGTVFGLLLGLGLCYILARYQFVELPSSVYYVTTLPVKIQFLDVLSICLAAIGVSFTATVYPAHRASVLNPVEILRYE
ncbi:MAG: lipoprotein-releasing ABC transporter permease subunit [Proteobacteria bacterium]|nr:lipoprotein-releasing ABC transporter permease subunit [Pseudomonadota bacterium]